MGNEVVKEGNILAGKKERKRRPQCAVGFPSCTY